MRRVTATIGGVGLLLVTLPWAVLLLFDMDFDGTSFWDGDCSSSDPTYEIVVFACGVVGIAVVVGLAVMTLRTHDAFRAAGLVCVGAAVVVVWIGVGDVMPQRESHVLPYQACGDP